MIEILYLLFALYILTNCSIQSSIKYTNNLNLRIRFNILQTENNVLKYYTYVNDEGNKVYFDILTEFVRISKNEAVEKLLDNKNINSYFKNRIDFLLRSIEKEKNKKTEFFTKLNRPIPTKLIKDFEDKQKSITFIRNKWLNKEKLLFVIEDEYSQILDQTSDFNQIKNIKVYQENNLTINVYYNEKKNPFNNYVRKPIISVGIMSEKIDDIQSFLNLKNINNKIMKPERETVFNDLYTDGKLQYYKEVWVEIYKKEREKMKYILSKNKLGKKKKLVEFEKWCKYQIIELDNRIIFLHFLNLKYSYFYYLRSIYWSNIYYREDRIFNSLITLYKGYKYYNKIQAEEIIKKLNYSREFRNSFFYDLNNINNLNLKDIV